MLLPEERVIFRSPPEMLPWVVGQVLDFAVGLLLLWIIAVSDSEWVRLLGLVAVLVLVGQLVWRMLDIWYTRYVLTSHRALRISGILRMDCEWMAWSKVTDVSIQRSVADRLFKTATIEIRNANENSSFRAMADVPRPLEFAETISRLVAARQGGVSIDE
jgi:uncharacterized membrane protein YdbT with pleckstrin-like domain